MRKWPWVVFLTFTLIGFASAAFAQTPVNNPQAAMWDHVDFSTAQKYELGYFLFPTLNGDCNFNGTPGAAPVQSDDLGKPPTTTGVGITAQLIARPKGCYKAKVRALDVSGLYSEWSEFSDPFLRRPVGPGKPVVK